MNLASNHKSILIFSHFLNTSVQIRTHLHALLYSIYTGFILYFINFAMIFGDKPRKEKNGRQAKDKEKGNKEEGRKEEEEEITSSKFLCFSK